MEVYICSYFHEAQDGLEPETEFLYELELPADFVPTPQDGEVSEFYLWDVEQVSVLYIASWCMYQVTCSVGHQHILCI